MFLTVLAVVRIGLVCFTARLQFREGWAPTRTFHREREEAAGCDQACRISLLNYYLIVKNRVPADIVSRAVGLILGEEVRDSLMD